MKTILVIDDSDSIRGVVTATLSAFGFATLEARDGLEGFQVALAHKPDLIICDVRMPGMDGFGALAAIREANSVSATPFILMTGSGGKDDFRRSMARGADDYLPKPFTCDELVEAVVSRLARQADLQREALQKAEELHNNTVHQLSREMTLPIKGILGAVSRMMTKPTDLGVSVIANCSRISESAQRLDRLAKSLK